MTDLLADLSDVLRPGGLLTYPAQVAAVVGLCHRAGVAVVPQGGNTGLCGGAVPDGSGTQVVLSLSRMRRVRHVDPDELTVTVEAGAVLATVQEAAAAVGCLFPLSLGSEGSCTVGGNIATNAGGTGGLRWGTTRQLVLGLEVVLPDGRVWDGRRALRKDNTGYDLKQLFIGAEGTLGVVTAAVLTLVPALRSTTTAGVAVPSVAAAVQLLGVLTRTCGDRLTAVELMGRPAVQFVLDHAVGARDPFSAVHPWYVLVELGDARADADLPTTLETALGEAFEAGHAVDAVVVDGARGQDLWALREGISEAQQHEGPSLKHDVTVPISAAPAFVEECAAAVEAVVPGTRVVVYGHVDDGNLHYNLSGPVGVPGRDFAARADQLARAVYGVVQAHTGSISAEHGIGTAKREHLVAFTDPVELDLMRGLKQLLDPAGLMNPGKVVQVGPTASTVT